MFTFSDRYNIFKDNFHWNGRSFRKNAVNWVKTPTFQLTFSNIVVEKSCVIEINRTSMVRSVDKYLSGWGWSSAYFHCTVRKLNRNEQRRRERYNFIYTFSFYCLSNIQSCTREKNELSYTDETQMIILGSLNSIRLLTHEWNKIIRSWN